jgi:anti-anti-sigma factor
LIGELDMATADQLYVQLEPAVRDGREVRLDASQLTFIDSAGLHAIVRLCTQCGNGGRVVIERPTSEVARVFELIRADTVPNLVIRTA